VNEVVYRGTWGNRPHVTRHEGGFVKILRDGGVSSGFSWGYLGAGPHRLAFALLLDALDPEFALNNAQALFDRFAKTFCYGWPEGGEWKITRAEIRAWAIRQPDCMISIDDALRDPDGFVEAMTAAVRGGES
jgi:hypothetical protein